MYLSTEITNGNTVTQDVAYGILKEEFMKLSSADMLKVTTGDMSPLQNAGYNAAKRICVNACKEEATNWVKENWYWVASAGIAFVATIYLITKK